MFRGFFNDSFFETPGSAFSRYFDGGDLHNGARGMPQMIQPAPIDPNHNSNNMPPGGPFNDHAISPFGGMDPFSSFNSILSEMNNFMNMSRGMTSQFMDPSRMMEMHPENGFGYSAMKVQTYVDDGSGQPKTYEAQQSTKYAPGGVKQVQKSVRDSEAGVEKMSVGRHLGDRGHVITKSRNRRSGDIEQNQDFNGFAEDEQPRFNQEWERMTQQFFQPHHHARTQRLPHTDNNINKLREQCLKPNRLSLDQA